MRTSDDVRVRFRLLRGAALVAVLAVVAALGPALPGAAVPTAPGSSLQPCARLATVAYPYAAPAVGTVRASMVFVDFSDAPGAESTEALYQRLAGAAAWYTENSYGQLDLEIVPAHGWHRMSEPSSAYPLRRDSAGTWEDERDYMQEAADLVDQVHDFSGSEIIYVVTPEGADQDYSPAFVFNPGDLVVADGADIHAGSALGGDIHHDGGALGPLVLAHETGHLLGERDYYHPSEAGDAAHRFVGPWDLMGSMFEGRHFSAWTKFRLGWLGPDRLRCVDTAQVDTFTLSPTTRGQGLTALVVPVGRHDAYVLEARHPERADSSICEGGLLLSHVDERRQQSDGPVQVVPARADAPESVAECGVLHGAPWVAGETFERDGLSFEVLEVAGDGSVTVQVSTSGISDLFPGEPDTIEQMDEASAIDLSIAISQRRFAAGEASYAVLSRDDVFADSLAGSPLTAEGPLLFTSSDRLDDRVVTEIHRAVGPDGLVYLLGGPSALGDGVADRAADEGMQVRRLQGQERYQTAVAIATEVAERFGTGRTAAVARAVSPTENPTAAWADSVTGGAWAAARRVPVLLTYSDRLHPDVAQWLDYQHTEQTVLFGGTSALAPAVASGVPGPRRVWGQLRYDTAAAIASSLWRSPTSSARRYLVMNGVHETGWTYGLAAAGIAADRGAPVLMLAHDGVPEATRELVSGCGAEIIAVGGPELISRATIQELSDEGARSC